MCIRDRDIAQQLLSTARYGRGPLVVLGGGRGEFTTVEQRDPEYDDKVGQRLDGRDLVGEWQRVHPRGAYAVSYTHLDVYKRQDVQRTQRAEPGFRRRPEGPARKRTQHEAGKHTLPERNLQPRGNQLHERTHFNQRATIAQQAAPVSYTHLLGKTDPSLRSG